MAAKWLGKEVMNKGLNWFSTNGNVMYVLDAYALGDTYAQVLTNAVNDPLVLTPASNVVTDQGNDSRVTIPQQSITIKTGATNASPDLHMAVCDSGNSEVLAVWEETTDQCIVECNTKNVPAATCDIQQPT